MSNMKVSIIITTYNRVDLIPLAIDSVIAQTYKNYELIIVDDGSTDETEKIIMRYQQQYENKIIYIVQSNKGCASARNTGIARSTGDFISFLDSDDMYEPNKLEIEVNLLLNNSECGFVYSPSIEMNNKIEWIMNPAAVGKPDQFARLLFMSNNARNGAILFRRVCFDDNRRFDEKLLHNEDSDLLQRIAILFKACYSYYPGLRVRIHQGSKSLRKEALVRAELRSAENVLRLNEKFRLQLGASAEKRICDLNTKLAIILLKNGKYRECLIILKQQSLVLVLTSIWRLSQRLIIKTSQMIKTKKVMVS